MFFDIVRIFSEDCCRAPEPLLLRPWQQVQDEIRLDRGDNNGVQQLSEECSIDRLPAAPTATPVLPFAVAERLDAAPATPTASVVAQQAMDEARLAADATAVASCSQGEMSSPSENMNDGAESWCCICSDDASVRCRQCEADNQSDEMELFCHRCFREMHRDDPDIQNHKPQALAVRGKSSTAERTNLRKCSLRRRG